MNPSAPSAASPVGAITVAVMGTVTPAATALAEALAATDTSAEPSATRYSVVDVNTVGRQVQADIVVCASAQVASVAAMVWPDADVVVLVPLRDDDTAVLDALDAGATACVRGVEVGLVAAYVHAVRRRREQTRSEERLGSVK
jgi:hypothetical protein